MMSIGFMEIFVILAVVVLGAGVVAAIVVAILSLMNRPRPGGHRTDVQPPEK